MTPSSLVLDVSGAAEFVMNRRRADEVKETILEAESILVPALYRFEATNLFWKYHAFHDVPLPRCQAALENVLGLPDVFVDGEELYEETFKLACLSDHVSYDVFYVVLAQRHNARLATFDSDLRDLAVRQEVTILD